MDTMLETSSRGRRTLDPKPATPILFAHFVLRSSNIQPMIDWYSTVLNMHVVQRTDYICFLTYDNEHHRLGIEPSRCLHHGPTVSIYYRDPDGNGVELQVDRYATKEATAAYFQTAEFKKNPIGVAFDPEALVQAYEAGAPESELLTMPEGPPAAPQSPPRPN